MVIRAIVEFDFEDKPTPKDLEKNLVGAFVKVKSGDYENAVVGWVESIVKEETK